MPHNLIGRNGFFAPPIRQGRRRFVQIFNRKICLPFNIRVKSGNFCLFFWRRFYFLIKCLLILLQVLGEFYSLTASKVGANGKLQWAWLRLAIQPTVKTVHAFNRCWFLLPQLLGKRNFFSFGRFFTSVGKIISKSSTSRLMPVATNASTDKKSLRRIWAEKALNPICLARNFKTFRASALSASAPSL